MTRPRGLRRYLGWVLATPSLLGRGEKFLVRAATMGTYLVEGRYAEVVASGRDNLALLDRLKGRRANPALEADIRLKLADALEALGEDDEAEVERHLAAEALERAPVDVVQLLNRGKALERENRYAEACDAYERALSAAAKLTESDRLQCMGHLFLASFNAGRPADCLRWAEEAIALGAKGVILRAAHRMAGIACGNLGRLDESEAHTRRAYEVAVAQGDRAEAAEILASLADHQRKVGKLTEAFEDARRAAAEHPKGERMALAVQAYVLKEWGRFDESLEMLRRFAAGAKNPIPALERRLRATLALDMSRIEAEAGRADDAWAHIREAIAELGTDAKLGLKCDAAASWTLAVRGQPDDSRRAADLATDRLSDFDEDPSTVRSVLYDLGMAARVRGDHEAGDDHWTRYLDLDPDPIYRPTAHHVRGECRLVAGEIHAARDDFRQAIACNISNHHARLAADRLRELGPG